MKDARNLKPEQRLREIARILAKGVLRMKNAWWKLNPSDLEKTTKLDDFIVVVINAIAGITV